MNVKLKRLAYGERYHDDSGWKRFLSVDIEDEKAMMELSGTDAHLSLEDLWWLVQAALEARELLGMDKLCPSGVAVSEKP